MEAKHTVAQARQSVYEIVTSRIIAELEAEVVLA
jgi:hypothetical protein